MNVHEHQAKQLLSNHGIPIPRGAVADSPETALQAAQDIGGSRFAVKAQIHAGDRGKAGGIRFVDSPEVVKLAAAELLNSKLVTAQTGPDGRTVRQVYVEQACDVGSELYLGMMVDRTNGRVTALASADGGIDIEEAFAQAPNQLLKLAIDPATGLQSKQLDTLISHLGLQSSQAEQTSRLIAGVYDLFMQLDASLIEINPLVVTTAGDVLPLDVKMSFDDNALFRHAELEKLRDAGEEDPERLERERHGFNYIKLDGNIGCMVTGAGLALATVDIIQQHGGAPANFLDLPPSATRVQAAAAFKRVLSDPHAKAILVNAVGGGFTRCDIIAEGMITALRDTEIRVPLVVRFAATNADTGIKLLQNTQLLFTSASDLDDAARKVVAAAGRSS